MLCRITQNKSENVFLSQFRRLTSRKCVFAVIKENKFSAYACQQRLQTNRITKDSFISNVCFNALFYFIFRIKTNYLISEKW